MAATAAVVPEYVHAPKHGVKLIVVDCSPSNAGHFSLDGGIPLSSTSTKGQRTPLIKTKLTEYWGRNLMRLVKLHHYAIRIVHVDAVNLSISIGKRFQGTCQFHALGD